MSMNLVGALVKQDMNIDTASQSDYKLEQTTSAERFRSYLIFTLCAFLYILPFMRLYLLGTDEGTLDYGAVRIVHGQVFARDFFEVIGPGTFYWLAAFFKLFGVSFWASRICLFLTSMGTALLMYFLSRRVCRSYKVLPVIFLAATYFGGLWPTISHHVDSNFFALLAVACMVLWYKRRSPSLLLVAGVAAGITTVFLQPKGLLIFAALLIWLWILYRRGNASLFYLGVITGGYLSVIALVLFYFWSKGALHSLIYVNFMWPLLHYQTVNSVPYAYDVPLNFKNHVVKGLIWTVPMAAVLVTPLLFIAAFPVLLPALGARYRWNIARADILLYWLCGGAVWLSELHRKDIGHLVYGSPLLMILCVHFLAEYRDKVALFALQLLAVSSVALALFNPLCFLLAAHSVPTQVGMVKTLKDIPLLTFLREHTSPGEEIFAYPYCPRYYFLGGAANPTPYSILLYNYNTPDQFREAVQILEQRKVRYVVWDLDLERAKADVFPASVRLPAGGLIIEPYLESHYRAVQDVDGFRIMERSDH
jgi:hypothetical protein